MAKRFSISRCFQFLLGIFLFLSSGGILAQEIISDIFTVHEGEEKDFPDGVNLTTNDSQLIVYGTVIINGNLEMSGNKSSMTLHPGSVVIVYGDVIASNKVSISAESYFIVYGNLTRITGSNQGTADFDNGDVYVFGTVDDTWGVEKCDPTTDSTCDYNDEGQFLEEDLPPAVQEAMNCLEIPIIPNETTCQGQNATFTLPSAINAAKTYQWQEKTTVDSWLDRANDTLPSLTIPNVQAALNGSQYRLVVRSDGDCIMGVSKPVTLTVTNLDFSLGEIQGETETCGKTGPFSYSIAEPAAEVTFSWEVPAGWSVEGASDGKAISVIPDHTSGEIKVTVTNTCGTSHLRSLPVKGLENIWNGSVSSLWEEPLNWNCGVVPTDNSTVIIPLNVPTYPIVNIGVTGVSKNIDVKAGASLTILGNIKISGTLTGILDAREGTVILSGTQPQIISANTFSGDLVQNLRIENPTQVKLEGAVKVSGVVTAGLGNLISNGYLTLVSDENRTALISGSGTGGVIGDIHLQRYMDPVFGYKYLSSPLMGITVGDFTPFLELQHSGTGFPHFYQYKENRQDMDGNDLTGWEAYINPSMPLKPMEGYAVNFGSAGGALTLSLTGEVYSGPLNKVLSNSNGTYTQGFHLVGNPYPSPVDWNKTAGWTKTNLDKAVYFFSSSPDDPYSGTYSSYIENGPSSDGKTTSIIPSMQGFFVHVTDGSSQAILGITDDARTEDQSQVFHKSSEEKISLLRISASFGQESLSDPAVIYFSPAAKVTFDTKLDALKLMNTNPEVPSFYSITPGQEKLSINALPAFHQDDPIRIPLGYSALKAGKLKIEVQDLENLPSEFQVYLVDHEKNLYVDLQEKKAYAAHISKGSNNTRLELVISREAISEPEQLFKIPMSVIASREKISVSVNLEATEQAEITVSSLSGQVLRTLSASSQEIVEIKGIKSAGVYIISLVSGKIRYSKKILIN